MHLDRLLVAACVCAFLVQSATAQGSPKPIKWQTLQPTKAKSRAGATLQIGKDGFVLVGGDLVQGDLHTIVVETPMTRVTGVRLEAAPHSSCPKGGPGREQRGHFQLAELTVHHTPPGRHRASRKLAVIDAATADTKSVNRPYYAGDQNNATACASRGAIAKTRDLRFSIDPVDGDPNGTRLTITLHYAPRSKAQIGYFRLSAASEANPLGDVEAPLGREWPKTQLRINDAIDRGVDALLAQQELDGSWREHADSYPTGATALAVYALLHSGVDRKDPAIVRAISFIRAHRPKKTYAAACQVLALCFLNDSRDKPRIKAMVEDLVSWLRADGHGYPSRRTDLSNTHYAALALHVARKSGYKISPKVWDRLAKATMKFQDQPRGGPVTGGARPAGFRYRDDGHKVTGSMTGAGVTILGICKQHIRGKRRELNKAIDRGNAWIREHFTATGNPNPDPKTPFTAPGGRRYYYLYAIERIGGILDRKLFGVHDWYRKGARYLVDVQKANGRWSNSQPQTCFALLFLTRATSRSSYTSDRIIRGKKTWGEIDAKAPFSVRIADEAPHAMWVLSWGKKTLEKFGHGDGKQRHLRVNKVEYWAAPSDSRDDKMQIGAVPGKPKVPAKEQRFAVQHHFAERGEHVVWARAVLDTPDGDQATVESKPIPLTVVKVKNDALLDYAGDVGRNLLVGKKLEVSASSEHGSDKATRAFDNLQALAWRSADDDPMPWLTLELKKPIKTNTILLSHVQMTDAKSRRNASRIRRVRIEFNGSRKRAVEAEMDPSPEKKTILTLPRAVNVKSLILRTLAVKAGRGGAKGVGLGELELQFRR